ncbi:MAG: hypothetical protein IPK17_30135 [Chloroflexi bacterium]|uniref:hypothetical protein n=1 Tax=Candidatus Flexifilum breve TaxID=3140694 RepID=UPI0031358C04|nr:hypothetical protein [Chloroflexota bacterium]
MTPVINEVIAAIGPDRRLHAHLRGRTLPESTTSAGGTMRILRRRLPHTRNHLDANTRDRW